MSTLGAQPRSTSRLRIAASVLLAVGSGLSCSRNPGEQLGLSGSGTTGDDSSGTVATGSDGGSDTAGTTGSTGCESDADCPEGEQCDVAMGVCTSPCTPGDERPCYSGPDETADVGACKTGVNVCNAGGSWELWCDGEVVPAAEICDNDSDDDCDGAVDDTDADGDGFGACSGDCCDIDGGGCTDAALVNPGAFEVVGNELDDDCDGEIDEATPACDANLASDSSDPLDYARAMDLCKFTVENPSDPEDRTWGVISAALTRADGSGQALAVQRSIRPGFGDVIGAQAGESLVVLSSGHAADANDTNPDFQPFQGGEDLGVSSDAPADWLAAHNGTFPNPAGCAEPWSTDANDPVMLTLRVRAPTNARSFSVRMFFLSAEYPEWVCSEFNDFFVALLDSTETDNPPDKNIATYDDGNTIWPVGVNLVMVAEGLFTQCENGEVGCARDVVTDYQGCLGTAQMVGTGFDLPDDGCGPGQTQVGGGTGWLEMSGNVTPGEIMELRLAIWDTSGHIFDSMVLLDDWTWSLQAADPGVAPG